MLKRQLILKKMFLYLGNRLSSIWIIIVAYAKFKILEGPLYLIVKIILTLQLIFKKMFLYIGNRLNSTWIMVLLKG